MTLILLSKILQLIEIMFSQLHIKLSARIYSWGKNSINNSLTVSTVYERGLHYGTLLDKNMDTCYLEH